MSVLGIDIGNENCVVAAVKERGIDVLLNDESKRETPGMVSFGAKQRFLGSTAVACATMNPTSTISQVKRLIGRSFDQPGVKEELSLFPFETSQGPDGGIQIHLQYMGEKHTFAPVQILAMLMKHLKRIAEKDLEAQVSDCVIGIPSYFTDLQRRLYLDAADIAGLKPLRLMHDCTAIALGYGIYKTDFSKSAPTIVVFVDMGHSDTQVAVVQFEHGHMKVLSHAFDSNLGSRDFDEVLFRYFATYFQEYNNIDVYSNTRACIRLRVACEKLKKVLSANPEAPLHIECLMDEIDVKGFITRDEFENLSSSLLDKISVPCLKALGDASVKLEMIHSVELVGSGSRIPAVTSFLTSIFKRDPRRTLNASECVARGCALRCAMISPLLRVKEYEVEDSLPFGIRFLEDGPVQSPLLFPKGHPIPSDKDFTLQKSHTFNIEAFYADHNELPPHASQAISIYEIGPFPVSNTGSTEVRVKACLTVNGIVTLESAFLLRGHMEETAIRRTAQNRRFVSDSGYPDARNGAQDRYPAYPVPSSSAAYANYPKVKGMKHLELQINELVHGGMTQAALSKAKEKEIQLTQQDIKVEQAKEKKNTLESYVYETRNKVLDTYHSFATESERDDLCQKLQQTEEWLYEDGDDESANVYTDRFQDLKKSVDPIENRYIEEEARVHAASNLRDCIKKGHEAAESLQPRGREQFIKICNGVAHWLEKKTQEQKSRPKNVDPVLQLNDFRNKEEFLYEKYKYIKSGAYREQPQQHNLLSVRGDNSHWEQQHNMSRVHGENTHRVQQQHNTSHAHGDNTHQEQQQQHNLPGIHGDNTHKEQQQQLPHDVSHLRGDGTHQVQQHNLSDVRGDNTHREQQQQLPYDMSSHVPGDSNHRVQQHNLSGVRADNTHREQKQQLPHDMSHVPRDSTRREQRGKNEKNGEDEEMDVD